MMKAIVKTARQAGHLELREMELPQPQAGEVRVRVRAASICGSDIHAYHYDPSYWFMTVPVVLGHEFAGVVDAVGEGVDTVKLGERVTVEAIHYCGECRSCRENNRHICERFQVIGLHKNGGFAHYVCVPQQFIHPLPAELKLEQAAVVEPLSIAVHAVYDRLKAERGQTVAVFGPGPIGMFTAQVLKSAGYIPVLFGIDSDEKTRLPAARALGIATVNLSQGIQEALSGLGIERFDHAVDCSGSSQAVEQGLAVLKKGGSLTLVGLFKDRADIDFSQLVRNEISLVGSYSSTSANYHEAIRLLVDGEVRVDNLLTYYPLEEYEQAFQEAMDKNCIKPVLLM
ncbi:zinc-dependent alcohol dehydrogenase [Brevibacillus sp. NRS-1366]|uniref:zinc-dependent alcohol dehydrogenase n=1 Tax=Brevibacillus sp. NRS-1366 TaxID=3233899 RepID=UPI003D21648A